MSKYPVADTILQQLGGNKFITMTGASSFSGGPNALGFRIPRRNKGRFVGVRIELEPNDTYKMVFIGDNNGSIANGTWKLTEKVFEGIYCDQLQEIFTEETGLYTRL